MSSVISPPLQIFAKQILSLVPYASNDRLGYLVEKLLPEEIQQRFETRQVESNDPKLAPGEADVVLIVNTASYFKDRVDYLKRLRKGISPGGKIVIIDFKKRNTPVGPEVSERVSLGEMEKNLKAAGYKHVSADDRTLEYQYIVVAKIE